MKYICASHGRMASGVKNTIEMLLGTQDNIYAMDAYIEKRDFIQDFLDLISSFEQHEQIIIFTDVLSGSVNQIISNYLNDFNIKVITGFNLSLIMEIVMRQGPLEDAEIDAIIEQAKDQMLFVNSFVKRKMESDL